MPLILSLLVATPTFSAFNNLCSICPACCVTQSPPFPPPPPMPPLPAWVSENGIPGAFSIVSSSPPNACQLSANGACVTDGAGQHSTNERCTFRANQPLFASATQYSTERYYDYITMAGTAYRYGGAGPRQVRLNTGDTFTWLSDGSVTYEGFTICAASTLAAPPPPAQKCTRRIAMSIVLDRSGSMNGHTNDGRVFASSLISQLLLSPSHSRASVTTFARDASTYTTMEAGTSEAAVLEAIERYGTAAEPAAGITNIGAALLAGEAQLLTAPSDTYMRVLVLMTDGLQSDEFGGPEAAVVTAPSPESKCMPSWRQPYRNLNVKQT